MAVTYQELDFVNTREMFQRAMEGGYAVPAYNFNNMEQLQGIILGCTEIPLLLAEADAGVPLFDTTAIHAEAALRYALDKE